MKQNREVLFGVLFAFASVCTVYASYEADWYHEANKKLKAEFVKVAYSPPDDVCVFTKSPLPPIKVLKVRPVKYQDRIIIDYPPVAVPLIWASNKYELPY